MIIYKKADVVKAIHNSKYTPKRTGLYKALKRASSRKETIVELLAGYELDSVEWNERVSKIAQLIGQSDKQIRDTIGVRRVQCTSTDSSEKNPSSNQFREKVTPSLDLPLLVAPLSSAPSTPRSLQCSPSPHESTTPNRKKRTHSASANDAAPLQSTTTPKNADNLKKAVVAFKTAVESNGVSKELLDQYAAIGEIIRSASDKNVQQHDNPKRRKVTSNRHERVSAAIVSVVPRFNGDTRGEWNQSDKSVVKSTICADAQDIRSLLAALTQCDANRASKVIIN